MNFFLLLMNEPALESKEIQITRTTNGPSCTKTRKCKTDTESKTYVPFE